MSSFGLRLLAAFSRVRRTCSCWCGYRDGDTQDLEITTNYAPVIRKSLEESFGLVYEDFRVVIPMTEISSARVFLPQAYKLFQQERAAKQQESREDAKEG